MQTKDLKERNKKENKNLKGWEYLIIFFNIALLLINIILLISVNKLLKEDNQKDNITDSERIKQYNTVFLGDSITHAYDLDKYFPIINTVNSGINGDNADMILTSLEERVYQYNPTKVFLLVGTNDIRDELTTKHITKTIEKIITSIKNNKPNIKIYVISVYPVNTNNEKYEQINMNSVGNRTNEKIIELNKSIRTMCKMNHIEYINIYDELLDEEGNLDIKYTLEGLHLTEEAYQKITNILIEYLEEEEIKILRETNK